MAAILEMERNGYSGGSVCMVIDSIKLERSDANCVQHARLGNTCGYRSFFHWPGLKYTAMVHPAESPENRHFLR